MATIKTLLEGTTQIAPRTKVSAVSDDDGTGLQALLNAKAAASDVTTLRTDVDALIASGYKSVSVSNLSTMKELREFIEAKNATGEHFLFDLSAYSEGAYVCGVAMSTFLSKNVCFIYDLLNQCAYGDYDGYDDTELISNYIEKNTMDNYGSFKITSDKLNTLGELNSYLNDFSGPSINSIGGHVFFDLSDYIDAAYVCTIYMFEQSDKKYCFVFDMINSKFYGDYSGYTDSTTIASYLTANGNDLVKTIPISDNTITLAQVKTILDEVNGLGHHVLFDTYALGQDGFYLTTIHTDGSTLTVFDLVGAKLNTVKYEDNITLVEVMQGAESVITEYNARVLTDLISGVSYRVAVLEGKSETADWSTIQANVVQGFGPEKYPTYDETTKTGATQITVDWTRQDSSSATETSYAMPYNVVAHTEKASTAPIAVLDDTWSIDSYHTSNAAGTDYGTETTHAANMMYMESQYTLPFGDQYDAVEAMATVSDNGLPEGTYYFLIAGDSWGGKNGQYYSFTTTAALTSGMQLRPNGSYDSAAAAVTTMNVYADGYTDTVSYSFALTNNGTTAPTEGIFLGSMFGTNMDETAKTYFKNDGNNHYLNHYHRIYLGYNRWSQSGLRQWLNAEGFDWWKPMNVWDRHPSYSGYRGFMSGLSDELKAVIKPVRRWQKLNSVTDGGVYEYTFDKIFLHVPYERYCAGNGSHEGSCTRWPWYRSLLDQWNETQGTSLSEFQLWQTYNVLIRRNQSGSAQYFFSSSARPDYARTVWLVNSSGYVNTDSANGGNCCLPAFVITL